MNTEALSFFLLSSFLNPQHPEQYLATSGHQIDICWRKRRIRGGRAKRPEVVKQTQSGSLIEGIPQMVEKFGLDNFKVSWKIKDST